MHRLLHPLLAIEDRSARYWPVILLIVSLLLCADWFGQVTNSPITTDAVYTARMAVNLVHDGVISGSAEPPLRPSMYREPAPAVSVAMGVVVADAIFGEARTDAYLSGDRARFLKYPHVLWKAISVLAAYWLILFMTGQRVAALAGVLLLGMSQPAIDTVFTEQEAATLLVVGMTMLVIGLRRRSVVALLFTGACLGVLALTKAAFLYVFAGFLLVVPIIEILMRPEEPPRRVGIAVIVLALAFGVVTLPWMYRNEVQLGSFSITERGGLSLYTRAVKDQMTWDEYKGSFYVWSHSRSVQRVIGAITGFSEKDLQRGGRLQRLNRMNNSDFAEGDRQAERAGRPDLAISFYRRARAERVKREMRYDAAGHPNPQDAADAELQSLALQEFKAHPLRHLAMTGPFVWRGAGLLAPLLLLISLVYSFRAGRNDLRLLTLMALGYVLFYALLTPFEYRYSLPLSPIIVVIGVVLVTAAWSRFRVSILGRHIVEPAAP